MLQGFTRRTFNRTARRPVKCDWLPIVAALVLLGLGPAQTDAQVTLFDNLDALEGWIDESEFWLSASGPDVRFAQQFLMGDNTTLDQVSVKLVRLGNVSGTLAFELWRDDGSDRPLLPSDPNRMIAELGTISDVTQMSRNATTYTFDDLAIDLAANDKYWVVANYSGLNIANGASSIGWVHHIWPVYDGPHILAPAPEEYASMRGTIGTDGAAHAHLYKDADPRWADYASVFGDEEAFFSMLVTAAPAAPEPPTVAQEIIYDNTDRMLGPGDRLFGEPGDWFSAQPLEMSGNDTVSSVTIHLSRLGTAEGTIAYSIWEDNGNGVPGEQVAEVGTVNVSQLDDVGPTPSQLPSVTFDTTALSLDPTGTYYLVGDARELVEGNTVLFGGIRDNQGTNGASEFLVAANRAEPPFEDGDWFPVANYGIGSRWLQMSLAAGVSLPGDYNHNGVVEQGDLDLVLLHWGQQLSPDALVAAGWTLDLPEGLIDQDELDRVLLGWGSTAPLSGAGGVPEPSSWVLGMAGLLAACVMGRRRR